MKNIHLLPTDKPSRVFNTNEGEYHFREHYVPDTIQTCKNHNIYITSSDKEVTKDEWWIDTKDNLVFKVTDEDILVIKEDGLPQGFFKIILTTDQDLINDGVQPIDDEFLEWFVKNPGCEKVEVIYSSLMKDYEYELLFPKETPQEEEQLPTKWFKTEQIETWIGESITTQGESIDETKGGRGKLIVMHQCGDNKEELISQLETMIYGLKEGFEYFIGN